MLFWGDIGLDTNICFQNILKGNGSSCTVCFLIRPTSLWATEDKVKTAVLLGAECVLPTLQGTERTREEKVELTRRRDQDTHYNRNILVQQSALMLQMQKPRHRKVRWFASHHLRPKVRTKTQSFLLIHQLSNSKPCGIQTQQYYFFLMILWVRTHLDNLFSSMVISTIRSGASHLLYTAYSGAGMFKMVPSFTWLEFGSKWVETELWKAMFYLHVRWSQESKTSYPAADFPWGEGSDTSHEPHNPPTFQGRKHGPQLSSLTYCRAY